MIGLLLKPASLLALLLVLPIMLIRAQPYDDHAGRALTGDDCRVPCLMGIRPGVTTTEGAIYSLQSHAWVANTVDEYPSPVRNAIFFGTRLPRTLIDWRWSAALPGWIDGDRDGTLIVEDRDVLEATLDTHLSLGEIILAFGPPDESHFAAASGQSGRRFEYNAWYASEGMFIRSEGACPTWHSYDLPVQIRFRSESPALPVTVPKAAVCS